MNYFSVGFVKCCAALLVGSTGDVIKEGFRTLPILFDETARLLNDMDQVPVHVVVLPSLLLTPTSRACDH